MKVFFINLLFLYASFVGCNKPDSGNFTSLDRVSLNRELSSLGEKYRMGSPHEAKTALWRQIANYEFRLEANLMDPWNVYYHIALRYGILGRIHEAEGRHTDLTEALYAESLRYWNRAMTLGPSLFNWEGISFEKDLVLSMADGYDVAWQPRWREELDFPPLKRTPGKGQATKPSKSE